MTIERPSDEALMAAVDWAEAHGYLVRCESVEEMVKYAATWGPDPPERLRALVGEHDPPGAQYNFILAPATGELMRPDGGGLLIHLPGVGILRTLPAWLLTLVRSLPTTQIAELTEAVAAGRLGPGSSARFALYLHHRADVLAAVVRARSKGNTRPIALLLDSDDPLAHQVADLMLGAKRPPTTEATGNLVISVWPVDTLMKPESPLPNEAREFVTKTADSERCPVIVVAGAGTSYFSLPLIAEEPAA